MGRYNLMFLCLCLIGVTNAQLQQNYYDLKCPRVENIVRKAVKAKIRQTFTTVPATLRLFFHDCFVEGCDASVMIASSSGTAEKDHPDNLSLAGDGFDTVIKAKAAVDEVPWCKNKVSCADILFMATRDVVYLSGGPDYPVELGRLDGLSSTASSVTGKLPKPDFDLNQLNSIFSANALSQSDMIALSAAHTLGFSHCSVIANRIYGNPVDPTLNSTYLTELRSACPKNVDPRVAINMDPTSPRSFDNDYFKNLQQGKGLFKSDQVLYTDSRSNGTVDKWAKNSEAFYEAFAVAMGKLGRVGVKTRSTGNGDIRRDCTAFN